MKKKGTKKGGLKNRGVDNMTTLVQEQNSNLSEYLKVINEFGEKISSSKEASAEFLKDIGVYDKTGKITERYKDVFKTK